MKKLLARDLPATAIVDVTDSENGRHNNAREHLREDRVFADPAMSIADFQFDATVAAAFDDMVSRSVPFYDEMQRMVVELATDFSEPGSRIYDLGCSTATTLTQLDRTVHPEVHFVGIDNSAEMLAKARIKLEKFAPNRRVDLVCQDLHEGLHIEDASVVMLVLTLQFVRPLYRERIIRRIAEGLRHNGALILIEKLVVSDSRLNRLYIEHYYGYKRSKGYLCCPSSSCLRHRARRLELTSIYSISSVF